ncbi:hypothetical protein TNCV_2766091 [Trichonephila clavipes]|nr:hypothetical protein TNCV_2766091 [Trichonephila clavipes]
MTQRTAPWENWHLERGFELLRTFGLVRWGLGGSDHVEGTGEKLSFASQAARYLNSCRGVISEPDLLGTSDSEILEGFLIRVSFRLIVPQLTQTYAQAARPSTISTATQTDPTLSNIICPPLQCLTPISSKNPLPGTSSSVSTFSTSSSTQDNLLPSPSGILPTIQGTESHSHTTPATLNSVSTENFPESVPNESNSEHSTAAEAQQIIKRKSRNRRKRSKNTETKISK